MTTFNVLSLLVSSATWLTALVGLLSLLTVKKQNRLVIKPMLTPVRQQVASRASDAGIEWFESFWGAAPDGEDNPGEGTTSRPHHSYALRLFNLGGGAAKDISVTWEVDTAGLVSLYKKLAGQAPESDDWSLDGKLLNFTKSSRRGAYQIANCIQSHQDYILPCSVEHKAHDVALPVFYPPLVTSVIQLLAQQGKFESAEWQTFERVAKLKLVLNYEDVPGNSYSAAFAFRLEISYFNNNGAFGGLLVPTRDWDKPSISFPFYKNLPLFNSQRA